MRFPKPQIGFKAFFKALYREWNEDNVGDVAAALTFYGVLALFPFLVFLVSLASVIIDAKTAESLVAELSRVAPPQVTDILAERIRAVGSDEKTGLLTLGAIGTIWAASGGVVALMRMLNECYDVKEARAWWKVRLVAIATTLVGAILSIVAASLAVAGPAIADKLPGPLPALVMWLRLPIAGLVIMFVMALLYYFLPDVEQEFRFVTPGSVVGTTLWLVASWGFSWYVRSFGKYEVTYGAIGGVIVLLLWMWVSSQVMLLGAEINAIWEHTSPEGKRVGDKEIDETRQAADLPKSWQKEAEGVDPAQKLDAGRRQQGRDGEGRPLRGGRGGGRPRRSHGGPGLLTGAALALFAFLIRRPRSS